MASSEIEFNITARDNASATLRKIRREATRTQFALIHQRLLIAFWATMLVLLGTALGVALAALAA